MALRMLVKGGSYLGVPCLGGRFYRFLALYCLVRVAI